MTDVISEYQKWKQQGEGLRTQARQAMEARFRTLLTEAAQLADEYRSDFGGQLKPPAQITAFRYKSASRPKAKKAAGKPPSAAPQPAPPPPPIKPNPKTAALEKRIAAARKKLEDAKASGAPTRPIEDKIYELEDDLRLMTQG
jgi:hypothetical protein